VTTVDYALTLGVVLPLAAFIFWIAPRITDLVYQMTCVLICWPLL
jgi:hypothetical protein